MAFAGIRGQVRPGAILAAALCLCAALCLAPADSAWAWFNDVTDSYPASQEVSVSGSVLTGADVPEGTYGITATTSSYMCKMTNVTLTSSGGGLWATFTLSKAYNALYLGTAEAAAAATNEDGTDISAYYVSDPLEGYVPRQFSLPIPALNEPMTVATYSGGTKGIDGGMWYTRTVVFNSSSEVEAAIAAAADGSEGGGSGDDEADDSGGSGDSGDEGGSDGGDSGDEGGSDSTSGDDSGSTGDDSSQDTAADDGDASDEGSQDNATSGEESDGTTGSSKGSSGSKKKNPQKSGSSSGKSDNAGGASGGSDGAAAADGANGDGANGEDDSAKSSSAEAASAEAASAEAASPEAGQAQGGARIREISFSGNQVVELGDGEDMLQDRSDAESSGPLGAGAAAAGALGAVNVALAGAYVVGLRRARPQLFSDAAAKLARFVRKD